MARPRIMRARPAGGVPRPRGDGPRFIGCATGAWRRSPPARGWPDRVRAGEHYGRAFPARAGMARPSQPSSRGIRGVPRPRGDGPAAALPRRTCRLRSPPARGWPGDDLARPCDVAAFPARAGMARRRSARTGRAARVPRPRGDGPSAVKLAAVSAARSPPARGWPAPARGAPGLVAAFPARAGMARPTKTVSVSSPGVPRPRGDGPDDAGCAFSLA